MTPLAAPIVFRALKQFRENDEKFKAAVGNDVHYAPYIKILQGLERQIERSKAKVTPLIHGGDLQQLQDALVQDRDEWTQ